MTTRLGMLTPSSNSALEPATARMLADTPEVTTHAARFRVTQIGLSAEALGQFDTGPMLPAAELLADARVHAILWNGTSAAWKGFASDERLCAAIADRTGIPASTTVLAFRDLFRERGVSRVGLVTPYTGDVQARIAANWGEAGFDCAAERHLGLADNFSFATVPPAELARMARAVAREGAEAVAVVCTNMDATALAPALEQELGIPVYCSIAVTLWKGLVLAGRDPSSHARWGGPFRP